MLQMSQCLNLREDTQPLDNSRLTLPKQHPEKNRKDMSDMCCKASLTIFVKELWFDMF